MSSLRRKPNSKFWIACFTDENGVQRQRSTATVDKSAAQRIALTIEDAYRQKMTEQRLRRVLNDVCESVNSRRVLNATAGEFFARWLTRKEAETRTAHHPLPRRGEPF